MCTFEYKVKKYSLCKLHMYKKCGYQAAVRGALYGIKCGYKAIKCGWELVRVVKQSLPP